MHRSLIREVLIGTGLALTVVLMAGLSSGIAQADAGEPSPNHVDASCDGNINSIDALLVLQFTAGLLASLPCEENADANEDGAINSLDASLILQFVAGLTYKPGLVITLEEYFDEFVILDQQAEQDLLALDGELKRALEVLTDIDELIAFIEEFFDQAGEAFDDFADGLNLLPPPPKVEDTHSELVAAVRVVENSLAALSDAFNDSDSPDEALAIIDEALVALDQASIDVARLCSELEVAAANNGITVALGCSVIE